MDIPDGAPALIRIPDSFAASGDPTDCGAYITKFDARADLNSAISMNVYFTPAKGYTLDDFVISVTDKDGKKYAGKGKVTDPKMDGSRIHIKIDGTASPQLGRDFHIKIALKNDPTKSATWTRSVITCAYVIQQTNTNAYAQNLVKALYQYYLAAVDVWPNAR